MFASRPQHFEKYRALRGSIIPLEGGIGHGKTTLGKSMVHFLESIGLKAKFYPEYFNKQLLDQYLSNMKQYAYTFQLVMLSKRIAIYREAEEYAQTGGIAIIDRSILGDMTFARMQRVKGFITETEWNIYYDMLLQEVQLTPSVTIFLDCTTKTALSRINKRGIKSEINSYDVDYMNDVHDAYMESMKDSINVRHIMVDWNAPALTEEGYVADTSIMTILDHCLPEQRYVCYECVPPTVPTITIFH